MDVTVKLDLNPVEAEFVRQGLELLKEKLDIERKIAIAAAARDVVQEAGILITNETAYANAIEQAKREIHEPDIPEAQSYYKVVRMLRALDHVMR